MDPRTNLLIHIFLKSSLYLKSFQINFISFTSIMEETMAMDQSIPTATSEFDDLFFRMRRQMISVMYTADFLCQINQ